ncbi:MAG: LysR family transcriptional regulator [Acidobacteriaceae bacterium]|nr:LysR family transcriptional regulator [Acidobacteriaceae bacterium]
MDHEIELRHLRYFVAVAEELHFGHAATRLHIAQPPLSQQIRRLEELLGHQLLLRTSRAVKLTHSGEVLLERARSLLGRMQEDLEQVRRVGRGESGYLRVGFIGSGMLTCLPALLGAYGKKYPHVELRLQEFYTSTLIKAIADGSVDVGFLRDGGPNPELQVEPLLEEKFIAIVPNHHRLARRARIRALDLREEPFVFFPRSAGQTAWERTIKLCERDGFRPHIVQEAPHWVTIVSLVAAGIGVTIAPACIRLIAPTAASCRPISGDGGSFIELAYRNDQNSPVATEFCRLARKVFRESAQRGN